MNRREFVLAGAGVAAGAATAAGWDQGQVPTMVEPVVIASGNGHKFRNGGTQTCVERAFTLLTQGSDPLEAVIAGVNIVELDPEESSVGFGGLPNAEGVVQLDASVMHGPLKRAGAVACLEGVRTPSLVAKHVMDETDHHLLVGKDAQTFARQMGFTIEADLNTDKSRGLWREWKRRIDPAHWLDPKKRAEAGWQVWQQMVAEGLLESNHAFGTINCNAIGPTGALAGVTTTSGLAWKLPGRVGDSPILGAGLYVDNDAGAAGSTGRGEANLFGLSSFLIVELLRQGQTPRDAGMEALKRIQARTVEKRLLNARGLPSFNVTFYILDKQGRYAGVSLYETDFALCTKNGPELRKTEPLFPGKPEM